MVRARIALFFLVGVAAACGPAGSIDLGQVGINEAAGTREDPYIARGLMFRSCYVRASPPSS